MLNKRGDCYVPRSLPNFHILRGWGRKGLSIDGTERICCFPGAYPEQDRLLTGDNRCAGREFNQWLLLLALLGQQANRVLCRRSTIARPLAPASCVPTIVVCQ